jgi:UDP:flavonoid glycosyltransferase YjiC (YdhE family)
MKITIATVGTRGDVQPYVALGLGLKNSGHQVQIATDPIFQAFIEHAGLGFAEVRADPRRAMQEDIPRIGSNPIYLLRWIDRHFTPLARSYFIDMRDACRGADAVLVSALAFSVMHVAQYYGIPSLATYLYPVTPTRAFSSMAASGLPRWLESFGWFNWWSFRLYNLAFFRMFLPVINTLRQEILDLAPIPWSYYFNLDVSEVPIIYGYSKHVLPHPEDWGAHQHITGYWFKEETSWLPPRELNKFLDGGSPPVYIGFGSMVDAEALKTTDIVLEALQITDQRAILHGGWSDLGASNLPETVYKVGDVPHSWLFPRMAAVVHHGGAGTTAAGLRDGVPSVIVPYFADQPFWAQRVHELSASPKPIPRKKLSAATLAKAIQEATQDRSILASSYSLGEKIRSEEGVKDAVEQIEMYLSNPQELLKFNP